MDPADAQGSSDPCLFSLWLNDSPGDVQKEEHIYHFFTFQNEKDLFSTDITDRSDIYLKFSY